MAYENRNPKEAPTSDLIALTRDNLHALCGSPCGEGFTRKQLSLLGVAWPPKKGWLSALRGKQITAARYMEIAEACAAKWKKPVFLPPAPLATMPDVGGMALKRLRDMCEDKWCPDNPNRNPRRARLLWESVMVLAERGGHQITDEERGLFL